MHEIPMPRPTELLTRIGLFAVLALSSCVPALKVREVRRDMPGTYGAGSDSISSAATPWAQFHSDPDLRALIDTALANNQELNIMLQEIEVLRNEARARKGEYLPFVGFAAGAGIEKAGEHTRNGAVERSLNIVEDTPFPEPLSDLGFGLRASWELDVWKRFRNARKAATLRYLGGIEGRNFMVTNLVAEIANSYYELLALDAQMSILRANITIQQDALEVVKLEKEAAKVTELAVRRFEAEVLKNRSDLFDIQQRIVETENRINFLVGRYPQPVQRASVGALDLVPAALSSGRASV